MSGVGANSAIMSNAMLSAKAGLTALAVAATVAFGVVGEKGPSIRQWRLWKAKACLRYLLGRCPKLPESGAKNFKGRWGLNG